MLINNTTAAASLDLVAECNGTEDSACGSQFPPYMKILISIVVLILFGIIIVVGLVGNFLVVLVVSLNHQMRNTTNYLIINLALADLLFIILCVPFTAADYALSYWPFGSGWCKSVQYLVIVTAYVSIYTLVLMSLDRFLAVVYPVESMSIRTEKNTVIAVTLTWAVIIVTCVPVLLAHGEIHSEGVPMCRFLRQDYNYDAFQLSFFVTAYMMPLLLVCVLYVIMLNKLWGTAPGGHMSEEALRGKRRVTRMVVVVVLVFAVCWCPIHLVLVLRSLDAYPLNPHTVMIQVVSQVLAYMNSCVNPILYAFLSENFRRAFRKVICCVPHLSNGQFFSTNNEIIKMASPKSQSKCKISSCIKNTRL